MKKSTATSIIAFQVLLLIAGCSNQHAPTKEASPDKKVDVLFVGPTEQASGFKKASISAKSHYDLIRAATKAKEDGLYDEAINIYNEAIDSAEFKFEKAVIYSNLAEIYNLRNDLESELKYQLLRAENTGNEIMKQKSLERAEEIRAVLVLNDNSDK